MDQPDRPAGPGPALTDPLVRLAAAVASDRLDEAVAAVRQAIVADPGGSLRDPLVKAWIARRFQYLFTVECTRSAEALTLAGLDDVGRPGSAMRQQLAARFLVGTDPDAVAGEQLDPPDPDLAGLT